MKNIRYIFIKMVISLCISCASIPSALPVWDASPDAYRQVFPDNRYIAQRGSGTSREAAELDSAVRLARFLDNEISSQTTNIEIVGVLTYEQQLEIRNYTQSQINLYGVRFVSDSYFDRRRREWVTVAYINRNEAWQVYSPRFRQQSETFNSLFLLANRESDPFRRILRLLAVQNHITNFDFQSANAFGQLLHPARMNEEFSVVRSNMSRLPSLLEDSRRNVSIYIDIPSDFNAMITNVFSRQLQLMGFPVTNIKNNATTICRVIITEGRGQQDTFTFYNPSLRAIFSSEAGELFSFTAVGERAVAVRPEVAKERAYQSLANRVNETFSLSTFD